MDPKALAWAGGDITKLNLGEAAGSPISGPPQPN
jgi:hypothetical protein